MTERSLRQFVEFVASRAEYMFKKQNRLLPMYHAIDVTGQDLIFPAPPFDKDKSVAIVRELLKEFGAVRVAFLDEAWMMDHEKTDADIEAVFRAGKSIARHPDRIEVIIISAEDAKEGALMATREIIRHGSKAVLGKLRIREFDGAEGRMVGLLPAPDRKH